MTRLNLLLLVVLVGCALGLVTAQHQARKRFSELAREQYLEQQCNVEFGQLLLEQSTWGTAARVEKIATRSLGMRVPEAAGVRAVTLEPAAAGDAAATWATPATSDAATTAPGMVAR